MNQDKLETISNLFEDKEIRSIWDKDKEDYDKKNPDKDRRRFDR